MLTITLVLVKLGSINPLTEPIVQWFQKLGFWNDDIERRILAARLFLPLDVETEFRNELRLPLGNSTKNLFNTIVEEQSTIYISQPKIWTEKRYCVSELIKLQLARIQGEEGLVIPNPIAYDPRTQFLIGTKVSPVL